MKKYLLVLGLLLSGGALTSCDDYLDVNTDPNNPISATPNFLLPNIISNGIQTQMFTALRTPYATQYLVSRTRNSGGNDQFYFTNAQSTNTFNYTYFYSAGNIGPMIAQAQAEGSVYYVGAGKIMMALVLAHATDMLGDIPYTEAFQGAANYTPKYDDQKDIYDTILRLLDEGLVEMNKPASANFRPLYVTTPSISGDILFQGKVEKWIRLANALKARQLQHLTKKGSYDPNAILALCANGMQSSADDAQLNYQAPAPPILNTTNIFGTTRANFGTATFSSNFIKYLDGRTFNGVVDPRFGVMAVNVPASGTAAAIVSTGVDPGVGVASPTSNLSPGSTTLTDFYSSWYARDLGYFEVITYHEQKFIEAEAAFLAGNKARALAAYREGIRAHMTKIGAGGTAASQGLTVTFPAITTAQITAYLASSAVAQTEAELDLRRIMEQKYIAMFLNPDSWSDMRRLDFSTDYYVNLQYPTGANTAAAGQYPRRLLPGATEVLYNPSEIARLGGNAPDYIIKPMWFDQR
jgi:Starch-binding associating with outer membrane